MQPWLGTIAHHHLFPERKANGALSLLGTEFKTKSLPDRQEGLLSFVLALGLNYIP